MRNQRSGGGNGYEKPSNSPESADGASVSPWHLPGYPAKDSHHWERRGCFDLQGLWGVYQKGISVLYLEANEAGVEAIVSIGLGSQVQWP